MCIGMRFGLNLRLSFGLPRDLPLHLGALAAGHLRRERRQDLARGHTETPGDHVSSQCTRARLRFKVSGCDRWASAALWLLGAGRPVLLFSTSSVFAASVGREVASLEICCALAARCREACLAVQHLERVCGIRRPRGGVARKLRGDAGGCQGMRRFPRRRQLILSGGGPRTIS